MWQTSCDRAARVTKTTLEVRVPLDKSGLPPRDGFSHTLQQLLRVLPRAVVAGIPSIERAVVTPLGSAHPGRCGARLSCSVQTCDCYWLLEHKMVMCGMWLVTRMTRA